MSAADPAARARKAPQPGLRLSVRLAVGLVFLLAQLLAVVWMYVNNPNELDELLVTAEANRIAREIPEMRAGARHSGDSACLWPTGRSAHS